MIKGFKDFLMRGNVVDLAVAVVIGTAFAAVVKSFTDGFINPLIASLGSSSAGSGLGFSLRGGALAEKTFINVGGFITTVINFVIVVAVVYFLVVASMNALLLRRKRGQEPDVEATPEDIALLQEIRDLLANRSLN